MITPEQSHTGQHLPTVRKTHLMRDLVLSAAVSLMVVGVHAWWIGAFTPFPKPDNAWFEHPTEITFCDSYWQVARPRGYGSAYLDARCLPFRPGGEGPGS